MVEGIIKNISVKSFEFGQVILEEISFRDNSYLKLYVALCS